ncbi:hypothetical protein SAMN06269173_1236 [Hymenobacter mucosus]|uniref:Uncharacterized protein n=1 Tax=Hymenobacter mucosus TaxID=1411120 RepID=A0A239BEX0_9BACT|nr:hypothetical protein SAMN06269173_1236 [Hymenobacter mucosus]
MDLYVLFGLLFCLLACFREGVWMKYSPENVARWHAQAARQKPYSPNALDLPTPFYPVAPSLIGQVITSPNSSNDFRQEVCSMPYVFCQIR